MMANALHLANLDVPVSAMLRRLQGFPDIGSAAAESVRCHRQRMRAVDPQQTFTKSA